MNRRMLITSLCSGAAGLLVSACAGPTFVLRYRLTLVVEVDGATKIGSSVIEVKYVNQEGAFLNLDPGMPWSSAYHGEATFVDLGPRGILFCLLQGDDSRPGSPQTPSNIPVTVFPSYGMGIARGKEGMGHLKDLISYKPRAGMDLAHLPMLVRFRDINDPSTVERVDPVNLEASFGPGVRILAANVNITDDPVTTEIGGTLKWLSSLKPGASLDGDTSIARVWHGPLSNKVYASSFKHPTQ